MKKRGLQFGIFLVPFHRVAGADDRRRRAHQDYPAWLERDFVALIIRVGEGMETVTYFEDVLGRPPGRSEDPLTDGVRAGTTLVGSPETVARGIQTLWDHSEGGFGGFLFRAHDWADREQSWRSYELFARWVMPRFQQSPDMPRASHEWAVANRKTIFGPNVDAL